jgi:hypothetical protein
VIFGDTFVAVKNISNDSVIIAFRGTNPKNIDDLVANYHIFYGSVERCERFKKAEDVYLEYSSRYKNIYLTGHSLGGSQAVYLAKKYGGMCWAWNPGQGLSEDYLNDNNIYTNINTYHIIGDPISELAGLENPGSLHRFPKIDSKNPLVNHAMRNFLGYKRH